MCIKKQVDEKIFTILEVNDKTEPQLLLAFLFFFSFCSTTFFMWLILRLQVSLCCQIPSEVCRPFKRNLVEKLLKRGEALLHNESMQGGQK